MAVADASWIVALLDADDARHGATRQQMEEAAEVNVSAVTLAECMFVLQRRQSGATQGERRRIAAQALRSFVALPNARLREPSDPGAALALVIERAHLSFPDAVSILLARNLGQPLWTFDREQAAALDDTR